MEIEQKLAGGVAIRFLSGPLVEKTISILKPVTILGRDPQSDIVVFDPKVSRRHACIRMVNGSWSIENLSQSSYITVNQQQVQYSILQNNAVVGLGENTSFVFLVQQSINQTVPASNFTEPEIVHPSYLQPSGEIPKPSSQALRAPNKIPANVSPSGTMLAPMGEVGIAMLTVSSNIHSDRKIHSLNKQTLNIGRDPENDIVIAEPMV